MLYFLLRESTAAEVMRQTGARFIHPFDNDDIISGQGTATLELIKQVKDLGEDIDCIIGWL